jgi:hypothetical protein
MNIWRSENKNDDKIIAYFNETIYKCNPKESEIENVFNNLKNNQAPTNNFTSVPLSYLKEIQLEEGKNYIEIFFGGDSTEQLKINDSLVKDDIFQYLKTNIPRTKFSIDKYSKLRAGKKPLIAMLVVLAICLWTFYISSGIEQGDEYKVVGNQRSVASIVLMLASLGTKNVLLIFGSLFGIALTSFILKTKSPKIVRKIVVQR